MTLQASPVGQESGVSRGIAKFTGRPRQAMRVRPGVDDDQDAREGGVVRR